MTVATQIRAQIRSLYAQRGIRHEQTLKPTRMALTRRSRGRVGFGDTTYARTDDLHFHFVGRQFPAKSRKSLPQNPVMSAQHDVPLRELRLGHVGEHVLEFTFC